MAAIALVAAGVACHFYAGLLRVKRDGAKVLVVSDATYTGEIPLGK